jgi:hypothetical protein
MVVGENVTDKLRTKIWKDKYIGFGKLLPNYRGEKQTKMVLKTGTDNRAYWMKEAPTAEPSFAQWSECFEVYMAGTKKWMAVTSYK